MKENLKISVIISVFNNANCIMTCFNSLAKQTYKNLEIIFVLDNSTDNSLAILQNLENIDNRVKILQTNSKAGIFNARFLGLSHCTGRYASFVDCDDFLADDYYEKVVEKINATKADVIITNGIDVFPKNKQQINVPQLLKQKFLLGIESVDIFFNEILKKNILMYVWAKIFDVSLFKKDKKFLSLVLNEKYINNGEDWLLSIVILNNSKKCIYCKDALYFYKHHKNQSTFIDNKIKLLSQCASNMIIFKYIKQYLVKNNLYEKYKENYNNWYNEQKRFFINASYLFKCNLEIKKLLDNSNKIIY